MASSGGTGTGARSKPPAPAAGDRIVLLGFVAAGKSTVGAILARRLGLVHYDVDRRLEARLGPLPAFSAAHGVPAFRDEERAEVARLPPGPAVISPGAGTVLHRATRRLLCQNARVFSLAVPAAVLATRLHGLPAARVQRPDLLRDAPQETARALAVELAGRQALYEELGERIDAAPAAEEVAQRILSRLGLA